MSRIPLRSSLLLLVMLGACQGQPVEERWDGPLDRGPLGDRTRSNELTADRPPSLTDGVSGEGTISIYIAGDLSKTAFSDGLTGQTPFDYQIAMSRYHVLLSATDPSPQLCFDHGKSPVIASMNGDNKVGFCKTQAIRTGSYTHGRTKVDWARYSVNGTYHVAGQKVPGKFTFFRAYSDTVVGGRAFKAGQGTITFSGLTTVEIPVNYPPPLSVPGLITFETVNGEHLVTFAFSRPLPIVQPDQHQHWARFHWKIFEAFRWAEESLPGYQAGVWDVASPTSEPVKLHGVSGYYTTSSID